MKNSLIFVALMFVASVVSAQQLCVCTAGCRITSDPYPQSGPQPTLCTVYKGGVFQNSANVVQSNTIPVSNASVCSPASAAYPQVAGAVSCEVTIPAQPAGTVTITMSASNAAGQSVQSAPFTFQSVAALPVLPGVPTNLRPN